MLKQDEEKQSKNTTQNVLETTMDKHTQERNRHEPYCKQLQAKTNRTSFSANGLNMCKTYEYISCFMHCLFFFNIYWLTSFTPPLSYWCACAKPGKWESIVVSNTFCVVFLLCFSSSCVLCMVVSNTYVFGFSGVSIFDCPFGIF
jgi:hypothetical protein